MNLNFKRPLLKNLNQIFTDYQKTTQTIINNYANQIQKIAASTPQIFTSLLNKHLQQFTNSNHFSPSYTNQNIQTTIFKQKGLKTKAVQLQMSFANPKFSNDKLYESFHFKSNISKSKRRQKSLAQQLDNLNQNIPSNKQNLMNINNLNDFTLNDLIQSAKKQFQRNIDQQQQDQDQQQQQYTLTDYSSNQSSNEGSYRIYEIQQQVKNKDALFNKVYSQDFKPNINFEKFKNLKVNNTGNAGGKFTQEFKPLNILNSPIKQKRLVCHNKIIPKWAQNLQNISKNNSKVDPDVIFGTCIVEKLNLACLFENQGYKYQQRTSSAKWKNPNFY